MLDTVRCVRLALRASKGRHPCKARRSRTSGARDWAPAGVRQGEPQECLRVSDKNAAPWSEPARPECVLGEFPLRIHVRGVGRWRLSGIPGGNGITCHSFSLPWRRPSGSTFGTDRNAALNSPSYRLCSSGNSHTSLDTRPFASEQFGSRLNQVEHGKESSTGALRYVLSAE